MNLVGSYQHHHHMMHEPFLFPQSARCHQERPYFQSWILNPGEMSPEFPIQPSYSPEFGGPGPAENHNRLDTLSGRLGRRKGVGPKKERRRTESINSAFAELRECIPNVPADTKLSKIKTLRLATSYIAYLMDVLAKDNQTGETEGFKAELKKGDNREGKRKREGTEVFNGSLGNGGKKLKGRTGWPQQVWALELNQ
ncbi:heart- and neural crest derivatives-expressed protein 1 [Latimeria chalumnae]|uniref:Heart- and neural crest derivatives-expressed protein 1 n=1 Tax=Latimeria chalumnae TaxID=7897 RepID=H3BH74_LATCH|nr:PREDICTED: heart- and neural crest derivatives-expressed protein 1 [Latimeria chalumnae]|eukprot:XP_005988374.1 PREDICTED: heart- and neural crest derivatives-expressed protein 1 [Latimeria chalumnae]